MSGDVRLGLVDLLASESKEVLSEYFGEVKRLCPEKATVNSMLGKFCTILSYAGIFPQLIRCRMGMLVYVRGDGSRDRCRQGGRRGRKSPTPI